MPGNTISAAFVSGAPALVCNDEVIAEGSAALIASGSRLDCE